MIARQLARRLRQAAGQALHGSTAAAAAAAAAGGVQSSRGAASSSGAGGTTAAGVRAMLLDPAPASYSSSWHWGARQHRCLPRRNPALETARRLVATGAQPPAEQLSTAVRKARWLAAPVGGIAGLFGSIVGVGGGVVIVPMIVNACKTIPQRLVSGTSLAAVVSTALVSTATYAQSGLVDPTAALVISPVAMLAAPWGARWTARLDCVALRRLLGYFLLAVAPLVPLKAYLLQGRGQEAEQQQQQQQQQQQRATNETAAGSAAAASNAAAAAPLALLPAAPGGQPAAAAGQQLTVKRATTWGREFWREQAAALGALPPATVAAMCGTGAVAGFASGLLGIGGGTIVTPLLALTMPYGQATVLGTSLLAMIPPSLAALAQHHRMGNVDWRMAAGLALGTALGGSLGSAAAVQAPTGALEVAFTLGMLFLGRKTLQSARR